MLKLATDLLVKLLLVFLSSLAGAIRLKRLETEAAEAKALRKAREADKRPPPTRDSIIDLLRNGKF